MKVQVIVKSSNKAAVAASKNLELIVMPTSTVLQVQEHIASITNTSSFPDQEMRFNGEVLDGSLALTACGIAEGGVLEFVFQPSEKTFAKQLSNLLGKRAVSVDELGLLYIHRYGTSMEEVLEAMGYGREKLRVFIEGQKCFSFDGDLVKTVEATEKSPEPSVDTCSTQQSASHGPIEVKVTVEMHVPGKIGRVISDDEAEETLLHLERSHTVAKAKEIIAAAELVPFPERQLLLGGKKLEDDVSLWKAGVTDGASLVLSVHATEAALVSQLEDLLRDCIALSPSELGLHYCQRFGTPLRQALRMLGLDGDIRRFLEGHPRFSLTGGCVTSLGEPQVGNALDSVIALLSESCFLNIDSIARAPNGEASATVNVQGLPAGADSCALESLQKALASGLEAVGIERASVIGDSIHVQTKGEAETVFLRLAAAC